MSNISQFKSGIVVDVGENSCMAIAVNTALEIRVPTGFDVVVAQSLRQAGVRVSKDGRLVKIPAKGNFAIIAKAETEFGKEFRVRRLNSQTLTTLLPQLKAAIDLKVVRAQSFAKETLIPGINQVSSRLVQAIERFQAEAIIAAAIELAKMCEDDEEATDGKSDEEKK